MNELASEILVDFKAITDDYKAKHLCKICGARKPAEHLGTCGSSYCQEADAYVNRATNVKLGTTMRHLAERAALTKVAVAVEMRARREGTCAEPTVAPVSQETAVMQAARRTLDTATRMLYVMGIKTNPTGGYLRINQPWAEYKHERDIIVTINCRSEALAYDIRIAEGYIGQGRQAQRRVTSKKGESTHDMAVRVVAVVVEILADSILE